jgi:dipeptidyl-peptidase-3
MSEDSTSAVVSSQYYFPDDQPVVALDAETAFESLTQREKLYAHHLSKASFVGGLVVLLQTSPEAPEIFRLLHRINISEDTESLRKAALSVGVTEREFKAFLIYGSGTSV